MTTETAPIRKLYKRCKRGRHDDCPGAHHTWDSRIHSLCSCECHDPDTMKPAAVVEAAQAIVTAPAAPKRTRKGKVDCYAVAATRHEADYALRGVKDHFGYSFFDPCDEHATSELAEIIAFGRSQKRVSASTAADCIRRTLLGCDACKQRTRNGMAAFAQTQGDVEQAITYKLPARNRPTRMSRETFIAKYDEGVLLAGSYQQGDAVKSSINRCANRDCHAMHNGMVVLHDTDELCGSCVYAGVKPKQRNK